MRRVTLDTNEFVCALSGGGKALHLFHAAIDGEIEIAISEPIISETIRVLREKFAWPPYDLLAARQRLERIGSMVKPARLIPGAVRTCESRQASGYSPESARGPLKRSPGGLARSRRVIFDLIS